MQRYLGMYAIKMQSPSPRSMFLRIFAEKGALLGQIDDNAPTRMLYQGNDAFVLGITAAPERSSTEA